MVPKPHQVEGINFIKSMRNCALWFEPRVGKSLTSLQAVLEMTEGEVLILAPKSAIAGWEDLCLTQGWGYWFFGGKVRPPQSRITMCNYESAWRHTRITRHPWAAIIFDESIRLANWNAKQAQVWMHHYYPNQIRVLLSGAPAPQSLIQFAHQMIVCRGSWFGYTTTWDYVKNYWEFNPLRRKWSCRFPAHEKEIRERIRKVGMSKTRKDAGIQDSKLYAWLRVPASRKQVSWSKALDKTKAEAELADKQMPGYLMRMQRIASGFNDDGDLVEQTKPKAIAEYVKEKQELEPGYTCVVFARFRAEVVLLSSLLKCGMVHGGCSADERGALFREFQSGKAKTLVAQVTTCKMGVDLSRADELIYCSSTWSADDYIQSLERATNMNKGEPTLVTQVVTEGLSFNIDYAIAMAIKSGKDFSESTLFG